MSSHWCVLGQGKGGTQSATNSRCRSFPTLCICRCLDLGVDAYSQTLTFHEKTLCQNEKLKQFKRQLTRLGLGFVPGDAFVVVVCGAWSTRPPYYHLRGTTCHPPSRRLSPCRVGSVLPWLSPRMAGCMGPAVPEVVEGASPTCCASSGNRGRSCYCSGPGPSPAEPPM